MRRRGFALAVVLVAAVMDILDGGIVNVVLPAVQSDLGAGDTAAVWIASGYTLSLGALLTVGGRLGGAHGPRTVLPISAGGFTFTSLACAVAPSTGVLIAARLGQGAMAALMVPQALTLIQLLYPARRRARALGLFAAVTGVCTVAGPVAGALLAQADVCGTGWRMVFLVNLPLGLFVLAAARVLPHAPKSGREPIDARSVMLLSLAAAALMVASSRAPAAGRPWWTWPVLALCAVATAVFGVRERRRSLRGAPVLIDTRLLRFRGFRGAVAVSGLVHASVFGFFLTLTLYLQQGLGRTAPAAALTVLPWTLGIPLTSVPASRWLVPRHGRRVLACGLAVMATALAGLLHHLLTHRDGPGTVELGCWLLVAGCGMGLVVAPVLGLGLAEVPVHLAGTASGLLNNVQQLAGAVGTAVVSAVYFARAASPVPGHAAATRAFAHATVCVLALCCTALLAVRLLPARHRRQES